MGISGNHKQQWCQKGYPLSPTLEWYINKVADYITSADSRGTDTTVYIFLYANNIILVSKSHAIVQHHLNALDSFAMKQKGGMSNHASLAC